MIHVPSYMRWLSEPHPPKAAWRNAAIGISLQPFWWQWGDVSRQFGGGRNHMFAIGPIRLAWRTC